VLFYTPLLLLVAVSRHVWGGDLCFELLHRSSEDG